jgi:hypothetical protein
LQTQCCCILHLNCKWGMAVAGSYSPCGLKIRRDGDSCYQNPIIVCCHWAVVALIMIWEHSIRPFVWLLWTV